MELCKHQNNMLGLSQTPARVVNGKDSRQPVHRRPARLMIGTTRSRVNLFMNRFRDLGYIDYGNNSKIRVRTSLSTVLLHD